MRGRETDWKEREVSTLNVHAADVSGTNLYVAGLGICCRSLLGPLINYIEYCVYSRVKIYMYVVMSVFIVFIVFIVLI